ncbi:MAG: nucleoside triphosphate pyrophosphatase [Minisyncoccia bacterium]|jgi:septum formation protein
MRKIVLASSSPRRTEILNRIGLKFVVDPGDYKEDMTLKLAPRELAKRLSLKKAESVARRHKDAVVIGADTCVVYKNRVLGKPGIPKRAKAMLKLLSGRTHSVFTGFTIIDTKTGKRVSRVSESKVYFKKLGNREMNAYVRTGEPLDKAGAYAVQGRGAAFIRKVEGDFFGIMGLPLYEIVHELAKFGVKIF